MVYRLQSNNWPWVHRSDPTGRRRRSAPIGPIRRFEQWRARFGHGPSEQSA
jgi:hypothetical protein